MLGLLLCIALVAPGRVRAQAEPPLVAAPAADTLHAFPPATVRAWQVGLLRPDRLQHAGLSFALGAAFTLASRDQVAGAATALALGALKELWDSRHGGADGVDLVADAVGATLGALAADPDAIHSP